MKMKILVADPLAQEGIEILEKEGYKVEQAVGLSEEKLKQRMGGFSALIVRSGVKVTREIIEAAPDLKVIGRAGTGLDNIDVETATRRGVIVMNTPGGNTISAAEHTVSLLLAVSRNIPQANEALRKGEWNRKKYMGTEIYKKTLGIIGLGRIGTEVAKRAQAFMMKVLAYDPFISPAKVDELGVTLCTLKELLPQVDYLTIHTPLSSQTRSLIDARAMALMKKGVFIINCARGGIVDESALYQAIKEGRVKGAALDVFEKGKPFNSPLLQLDSVIVTPHLGASTAEAQTRVAEEIAHQIVDVLKRNKVVNAVNFPVFPSQMEKKMGGYLSLAEKMGILSAQLMESHPGRIELIYKGEITEYDLSIFTTVFLKALLGFFLKEVVNYVNASLIARERGLEVLQTKMDGKSEGFASLIVAKLISEKGEKKIEGTILEKDTPYITAIDSFSLEFVPQGTLLICSHLDKPGVVGKIATVLGKYGVNIGGLRMGRNISRDINMSVYSLDSTLPSEGLEILRETEEVLEAKLALL